MDCPEMPLVTAFDDVRWASDGRYRVIHPYHPLAGQEFELVGYANIWNEHQVFYREVGNERVRSLSVIWSDLVGSTPSPFWSPFR